MLSPTVAEVASIAAIADPIARNLRITQCYHELSAAAARRVAPGANWCTFATWASRQAGVTIRREDVAQAVDRVLGSPDIRAVLERVAQLAVREVRGTSISAVAERVRRTLDLDGAFRRASDAVAAGNLKVFAEIGHEFARWLEGGDDVPDEARIDAFCAALRDGDPPEGQALLRKAFRAYASAGRATAADERAEWMLYANLLVGMHEQTRLQPEITRSLEAAIDEAAVRARLLELLIPGWWRRFRARIARATGRPLPLDQAIDSLLSEVRRHVRVTITDGLMTIRLPGTDLRLGRDVAGVAPAELAALANPELRSLVMRIDPNPDSVAGSGARDWGNLGDRMRFIGDFFRTWHARGELLEPPFTAAELEATGSSGISPRR